MNDLTLEQFTKFDNEKIINNPKNNTDIKKNINKSKKRKTLQLTKNLRFR